MLGRRKHKPSDTSPIRESNASYLVREYVDGLLAQECFERPQARQWAPPAASSDDLGSPCWGWRMPTAGPRAPGPEASHVLLENLGGEDRGFRSRAVD